MDEAPLPPPGLLRRLIAMVYDTLLVIPLIMAEQQQIAVT